MKILVTGGAGFIGSHVADRLVEGGHSVIIVDNLSTGNKKNLNSRAIFYKVDILQPGIANVFKKEKPEIVFHFAAHTEARPSVEDPLSDARTNILGSLNILEQCRKYGVKKIVFASTGGEIYGDAMKIPTNEEYVPNPVSPYGITKLAIEKYLQFYKNIYGIDFVALRYANVYGPRQSAKGEAGVIAIFTEKILNGKQPIIHGNGKQTKDYIFIEDVVQATVQALKKNVHGTYNIGTGKETSVVEIFKKIQTVIGKIVKEKHGDFPSIGFKRGCLSISKAKKVLGFRPKYNLEKGLEVTINWYKKNI